MKRVIIVHRWYGTPTSDWYPWLKQELEKKGFSVSIPEMPNTHAPAIKSWVAALARAVGTPDKDTYFVGHSIGCQTILRYLDGIPVKTGGAVFVAGWFALTSEATPTKKEKDIARPWLKDFPDTEKIKTRVKGFVTLLSKNDPYVEWRAAECDFSDFSEIILEEKQGHYDEDTGVTKVPAVLKAVLSLAKPL